MNVEENKNIVRRYLQEVFEKDNLTAAEEHLADNYLCYEPGAEKPAGREATIRDLKAYRAAFPDERLSNLELEAEGDAVTSRCLLEGTHRGEFAGMPASGNWISLPYTVKFRLANRKIVEERDDYDPQTFMQALGATHMGEHGGL